MKPVFVLAGALALVPVVSQAQAWGPAMTECVQEVERTHPGNTSGSWPIWTRCAVARTYGNRIPAAKLDACIQKIWDRRLREKTCALCGNDPAAEAIQCAGG